MIRARAGRSARSPIAFLFTAGISALLTTASCGSGAVERVDNDRGPAASEIGSSPVPSSPLPAQTASQSQSMPSSGEPVRGAGATAKQGKSAQEAPGQGTSGPGAGGVWAALGTKPLLGIACGDDPAFYAIARGLNAARCYVLYEQFILTKGQIDPPKFRKHIQDVVPERWDGLVCLDIESDWPDALLGDPQSAEYAHAAASLLRVLAIAREVRPEAKWSYYAFPNVRFWVKDAKGATCGWDRVSPASKEDAERKAMQMQVIVDACDWVAPTVYDSYLDSATPNAIEAQKARVRELVALSRAMGAKSGKPKPVLPFVWHRIHPSNEAHGLSLLSAAEFISGQIEPSLASGADGVIWWGADRSMSEAIVRRQPEEARGVEKDSKAALARFAASRITLLNAIAPLFPK